MRVLCLTITVLSPTMPPSLAPSQSVPSVPLLGLAVSPPSSEAEEEEVSTCAEGGVHCHQSELDVTMHMHMPPGGIFYVLHVTMTDTCLLWPS